MTIKIRHCLTRIIILLISTIVVGCSDKATPDMPEPVISLSEASDISRTGATVIANIDGKGAAKLSYITLYYGLTGSTELKHIDCNPDKKYIQVSLTDLVPGHSYSCYMEGGTSTATLKSNDITFNTFPNEIPRLSVPAPLSTGPLGIIVEFDISDDGGEAISEAGCEVRPIGQSESRRVHVERPEERNLRLNINGLIPGTTYTITPFASNSIGEAHGEPLQYTTQSSIVLQQPGVLASLLESEANLELQVLTISGFMNGDDFRTLRAILGVPVAVEGHYSGITATDIDLTDVTITEGGGTYDGSHFTVSDELTTGIFADCMHLRNAILPNTARRIARDAFARCRALESLSISAGVEDLLPSSECTALKTIDVSKANSRFASIDGALFNHDVTQIMWFPAGKAGEYHLPATITAIGENAFAGTHITGLTIPASVTTISRGAFAGSALVEISLTNITNVSEGMFQNCTGLTTVHLGPSTEYIGNFAFDHTDIQTIYLAADIPPYTAENAFTNGDTTIYGTCTLYIPKGCRKLYAEHTKWGKFSNIEEFQP